MSTSGVFTYIRLHADYYLPNCDPSSVFNFYGFRDCEPPNRVFACLQFTELQTEYFNVCEPNDDPEFAARGYSQSNTFFKCDNCYSEAPYYCTYSC